LDDRYICKSGGVSLSDKAAVLIDNGYLSKVLKYKFDEVKINHELFSDILCGSCERFRTYFYDCPPFQSEVPTLEEKERKSKSDKFYYNLRNNKRFEIRMGRLQKIGNPPQFTQKGVDVLLSVDLVRLAWTGKINKAILVTGDSDFVPAVENAKDAGVIVELYYHEGMNLSRELFQICDDRYLITRDVIDKCRH
jgi:uncharacterized LabA/DUF88 family protein